MVTHTGFGIILRCEPRDCTADGEPCPLCFGQAWTPPRFDPDAIRAVEERGAALPAEDSPGGYPTVSVDAEEWAAMVARMVAAEVSDGRVLGD